MHYVYLNENNVVMDQAQIDPYLVFTPEYASQFIEAPDEVTFYWTYEDGVFSPPYVNWKLQNKQQAQQYLQETDWTATVDISNPQYSDPYLMNQDEFLSYRSNVRAIAVNPPDYEITNWPIVPPEVWSS